LDNKNCGVCGKEIAGEEGVVCSDCKSAIRRKSRRRLWYYGAAAVIFMLAGAAFLYGENNAWEFSWDSLLRRPAAVVNGEMIAWSEARERFKITRLMMEKEYGKELFTGERGRVYLTDLESDVLERIISERLVAQEARRLNIQVGDDRVKNEIQEIGREIYGNWENFQASLREDGISPEYLSAHVRNLLLRQEIKKTQAPAGADPDEYFSVWLTRDRQSAKVTFNKAISSIEVSAQGQGSCCGTTDVRSSGGCGGRGGGGCGGQQAAAGPLDPQLKSAASAAALAAYRKTNPAEKDVAAQVTDYGCHVQVDIEKGGKIVRSYIYQNGSVIDNS
jgi:predicted nucleic acid-binding Zn ribbon protein